jgi:PadR family transcriptional regulator PadR
MYKGTQIFITPINTMSENLNEKFASIRKGLLEFSLLKLINSRPVYVADILRRLQETEMATQEGTLYPLLSKMRRERLVDYEWKESENGPPRKYYHLTSTGTLRLHETNKYWKNIINTIKDLEK